MGVMVGCVLINLASNIIRGDILLFAVTNVALNLLQVGIAALLALGIGIGRLMAALVEKFNDDRGIIWPTSASPFLVNLRII